MASFAPVVLARVLRFQTLFVLLLLLAFGLSYAVAQDYPPYGPHVPTAQFDHVIRPQLTPPAVSLLKRWNRQSSAVRVEHRTRGL